MIRVFALSLPDEEARALKNDPNAQAALLGVVTLDRKHVEVFPVDDLGDMKLADYLVEGSGAQADTLGQDRAKLGALDGWVMLVYSGAFKGAAQELATASGLTLIGTYPQVGTDWTGDVDLSTPSALPQDNKNVEIPVKKRPSDAAMSGRIAMLALAFAFLLVGLMIWVSS